MQSSVVRRKKLALVCYIIDIPLQQWNFQTWLSWSSVLSKWTFQIRIFRDFIDQETLSVLKLSTLYSLHSFDFIPHNARNAPLHFASLLRAVKWLDVYRITSFVKDPCWILFILQGRFVGRVLRSIDLAL